ncbi:glycoside hydrolase family protein [Variovorax sp. PAMC26660]|uniref:glycoside hydrolase family protein n=1 Tax=Variovorax sp. PAMC26660 TaxID=2762322 RepID=UPI001C9B7F98|nr:glycoside hydrolase family protein [Variovorax sp. PAMC26660]
MSAQRVRIAVLALTLSAAGFVGIVSREGYTDRAVIPTKGDVPTIGFGTTEGVQLGDTTTPVVAMRRALADSKKYEGALKQCVSAPLYQEEYDLYVSLAYNIGAFNFCSGGRAGGTSNIVRRLNAGDYSGACDAILDWKYAAGFDCSTPGNKRCAGVWADRQAAQKQCKAVQ